MADVRAELSVRCPACGGPAPRVLEQETPDGMLAGCRLEVYRCADEACGRRAVVFYEPSGAGLPEEALTFVEREVMRHGSFFPSDHTQNERGLRRW